MEDTPPWITNSSFWAVNKINTYIYCTNCYFTGYIIAVLVLVYMYMYIEITTPFNLR